MNDTRQSVSTNYGISSRFLGPLRYRFFFRRGNNQRFARIYYDFSSDNDRDNISVSFVILFIYRGEIEKSTYYEA